MVLEFLINHLLVLSSHLNSNYFLVFCSEPIGLINKSRLNTFGHSEFDEGSGSTKLLLHLDHSSFSAK